MAALVLFHSRCRRRCCHGPATRNTWFIVSKPAIACALLQYHYQPASAQAVLRVLMTFLVGVAVHVRSATVRP